MQETNKQTQDNKNIYVLFNPWSPLWEWRLEEQHLPAMQVWLGMRKGWIGAVELLFSHLVTFKHLI